MVVTALVALGPSAPPMRAPSEATPSPFPTPTSVPACEAGEECPNVPDDFFEPRAPLEGTGPFVVYSIGTDRIREIYALDLATNQTTLLARSAEVYGPGFVGRGSTLLIPLPDGSVSVLRRGSRLGDRRLRLGENTAALAISPDDRWLAVATRKANDELGATITLRALDGSSKPRRLVTFATGSDSSGGALDLFWSSPTSLTIVDDCHCDGGPGYATALSLSLKGAFQTIPFLKDHNPFGPSPRSDGATFAFVDIPSIDCFESAHACDSVPHTLSVADLRARTLRAVAKRRAEGFWNVRLSPRGSHVAAMRERSPEIEIYDVSRRKKIASSWFSAVSFEPVAWIDEKRLVALASSLDLVGDRETGRLLLVTLRSGQESIEPTTLVSGVSLHYLGLVS